MGFIYWCLKREWTNCERRRGKSLELVTYQEVIAFQSPVVKMNSGEIGGSEAVSHLVTKSQKIVGSSPTPQK
jgi:hypothetical protein